MGEPGRREDARAVALAQELGAQLARLRGAGPKIKQFLSMVQLDPPSDVEPPRSAFGALPAGTAAIPFAGVRKVIEQDLGARVKRLFDDIDEEPFALTSLGQVHEARTVDGKIVAVKVQHPGVAEAIEADLRNLGLVRPILKRLAPELDTTAVLAEVRDRLADEVDYELEGEHQRRLQRLLRGHPHVLVPHVHTDLSARRVLVTEYIDGLQGGEIARLAEPERDRIAEIAFRCYLDLSLRVGAVAGDPHPDNCILCPDGRLCLLDFGLLRDLDADSLQGERAVMRAIAGGDAHDVHAALASRGYLPDPGSVDAGALFEHLAAGGRWMLAGGFLRIDPAYVTGIFELAYPPRSPHFPSMRRMAPPPATLLLRRMEIQLLALLGSFNAGGDWGAMTAERHSGTPASTALGREQEAFWTRHARRERG
jgi:predicted unusual protein kinase regulating ubiquinone biosynthesis (AarF/ABC1/UbiB family)